MAGKEARLLACVALVVLLLLVEVMIDRFFHKFHLYTQ
jgi:hypothetical protein